jgi:hypothetical protein
MPRDWPEDSRNEPGAIVGLDQASIDTIARHVVEILRDESLATTSKSWTAAEVAARFGVSRSWVYENAERLGAIRLGDGARPRLRFDRERVREVLQGGQRSKSAPRAVSSSRKWIAGGDLIPIRGQ